MVLACKKKELYSGIGIRFFNGKEQITNEPTPPPEQGSINQFKTGNIRLFGAVTCLLNLTRKSS